MIHMTYGELFLVCFIGIAVWDLIKAIIRKKRKGVSR